MRRRACTLGLLLLAVLAVRAAPARAVTDTVSVTRAPVTRPLPDDFLGLALEYSTIPAWEPAAGQAPNTPFIALAKALEPGGKLSVRIGGQSTDRSWWPVAGVKQPLGVTYSLGPAWLAAARELVSGTGATLMLGVNLEAGSPRIAHVEADALVNGVGAANVASLQVGNEPNLYLDTPWYRVQDGRTLPWYAKTGVPEYARPASWGPAAFEAQFGAFEKVLPDLPLAGPETSPGPWLDAFDQLVSPRSRVRMVTTHAYGLNNCVKDPDRPLYPTVAHLLTPLASRGMYAGIGPSLALAHRDGATLRVDEMGSITCNGKPGVSDTFASALWGMDALFEAARLGIDGVNLHSFPGSDNGLFDFTYERSTHRWRAFVHPLYDGALMFAQAAPAGSRLLHIATGAPSTLRTWATLGVDHAVRVLLINDGPTGVLAHVHVPAGYGHTPAAVERLTAPSAAATGGVRLGGHPFSSTLTGVPRTPVAQSARPSGGVDTVSLPATSAALLTLTLPAAAG